MFNCINWAWRVEGLTPNTKFVLVAAATTSGDDVIARPEMERMVEMTGISELGIKEYLFRLVDMKLLIPTSEPDRYRMETNRTTGDMPEDDV